MTKNTKRILLAGSISLTGFASTLGWYNLSDNSTQSTASAKPIARLVSAINDVQKKPVQKIIWQSAIENEVLRVGEAIRTSQNAEARIEFLSSATFIELEPDSAIILEESDGQVSLEFLKGHIAVDSSTSSKSGASQINLKTGDKNIALGNSQLTLGKSKTGNLDVQVIKGDVKGFDSSQLAKIKIISPNPQIPLYVNPKTNELAVFEWAPLDKGYTVFLESGTQRENLLPVNGATGAGDSGKLLAPVNLGKNFYRLKATSTDPSQPELSSSVFRTSVLAKIPPVPLSPQNKSSLSLNKNENTVSFLWSNPAGFNKLILEISTTADLKTKIKTEYLEDALSYTFPVEKPGAYYWRISGVLEGRKEVVSSPIQTVNVSLLDKVLPPELELPRANEKLIIDPEKTKTINLSWKHSIGADRYNVQVEKLSSEVNKRNPASAEIVFEGEFKALQAAVQDLKVGQYTWSVKAVDSQNQESTPSEKRSFSIDSLPLVEWADGKSEQEHYYISLKPSLKLEWKNPGLTVSYWKIELKHNDDEKKYFKKTDSTTTELNVPKDGIYNVEVEARDSKDRLIAKSNLRNVKVAAAPLLPAPNYLSTTPTEIKAEPNGSAQVSWSSVNGATQYLLKIKRADGGIDEYKFNSIEGTLTNLMPGNHRITLQSIDENGRIGPASEERSIVVPSVSNMRAPKLKGVKIK